MSSKHLYNLQEILMSGGDCRIKLQENDLNDLFTSPVPHDNLIQRANCTASYINSQQAHKLLEILQDIEQKKISFSQSMSGVHNRLRKILQLSDEIGICTISSGTDAEYIPLWVVDSLFSNTKIYNIVCGIGELGSNSLRTASGLYFKSLTPSGNLVNVNERLFAQEIVATGLARHIVNGDEQIDFQQCLQIMENRQAPNEIVLCHILEPSKIGYRMDVVERLASLRKIYSNVFFVVDACQCRTTVSRIQSYLEAQCFVIVTGSKFPEGPPFSGAVLIPDLFVKKCQNLQSVNKNLGINKFISYFDVSCNLGVLKQSTRKWQNIGLMLRWHCALDNWEPLLSIPDEKQKKIVLDWLSHVRKIINKYDNLKFFCGAEPQLGSIADFNTIISFIVLDSGRPLDKECLSELRYQMLFPFDYMQTNNNDQKSALSRRFFIGQPVQLARFSVLRVAIGAKLIQSIYNFGHQKFYDEDELLFLKLSILAKKINCSKRDTQCIC